MLAESAEVLCCKYVMCTYYVSICYAQVEVLCNMSGIHGSAKYLLLQVSSRESYQGSVSWNFFSNKIFEGNVLHGQKAIDFNYHCLTPQLSLQ